MEKLSYSVGSVHWRMSELYRGFEDVEDCFLSTIEGVPIVRRFGLKILNRLEQLWKLCRGLLQELPHVQNCTLISSVEGWAIVGLSYSMMDEDYLSPKFANLFSLGNLLLANMKCGLVDSLYIDDQKGCTVLIPVGDDGILVILVDVPSIGIPEPLMETIKMRANEMAKII